MKLIRVEDEDDRVVAVAKLVTDKDEPGRDGAAGGEAPANGGEVGPTNGETPGAPNGDAPTTDRGEPAFTVLRQT